MLNTPDAKSYRGYKDLYHNQKQGIDYEITVLPKATSKVAIIAPHAGAIERDTSQVARAIAGNDFNLYLFEGIRSSNNYEALHLSSHLFDEPECLSLISDIPTVVSIHGCNGREPIIYLGGLNSELNEQLVDALSTIEIIVKVDGHAYPGINPKNICNRGLTKKGVQIELTDVLRGTTLSTEVVSKVRQVLLNLD